MLMVPSCVSQKYLSRFWGRATWPNEWGWGGVDGSIEIKGMWSLSRNHSSMCTEHLGVPDAMPWGEDDVQGRQVSAFKELTEEWR